MKLLEHQAKQRFASAGIPVPEGRLARTPEEAADAARDLGRVAVKAQVPVGGRGKAGGIALVDSPDEARREAARILAMDIHGFPVRSVWCERVLAVAAELYLGVALDRSAGRLVVLLSAAGGMDIEEVAASSPEAIARLVPDPFRGPQPYEVRAMAFAALRGAPALAGRAAALAAELVPLVRRLYELSVDLDATTCEINPLVITGAGTLTAADGKLEVDDNATFRHPDVAADIGGEEGAAAGEDPFEVEARRRGLTYVHLAGSIGCIGNGAGLVMNTLDLVKREGGEPACFLDIGGGARAEVVREALDMVLSDPAVRGVFLNVFGGITRGDEVARGIIRARDELGIAVPLVVRMTGTRADEGRRLLAEAGVPSVVGAPDAAREIVAITRTAAGAGH